MGREEHGLLWTRLFQVLCIMPCKILWIYSYFMFIYTTFWLTVGCHLSPSIYFNYLLHIKRATCTLMLYLLAWIVCKFQELHYSSSPNDTLYTSSACQWHAFPSFLPQRGCIFCFHKYERNTFQKILYIFCLHC